MNKSTNKKTPFLKVFGLLIVTFSILIINTQRTKNEILRHGVQNEATVDFYKYESRIENAKSQKRINFYRIDFHYNYQGKEYSTSQDIQVNDFKEKVGRKLNNGDKISIRHSKKNPKKVEILKQ